MPTDIRYLPRIFVIGMGKTGKTALAREIQRKLNLVHVKVAHVIREFMRNPFSQTAQEMVRRLRDGEQVDDQLVVRLLKQRLSQQDVLERGFVLDGYPRTQAQAELLQKYEITPDKVLYCSLEEKEIIRRIGKNYSLCREKQRAFLSRNRHEDQQGRGGERGGTEKGQVRLDPVQQGDLRPNENGPLLSGLQ